MPNINTTRSDLESLFIAGWGNTTPIAYDNVPFDNNGIDEYVHVRFTVYDSRNFTIGSQLVAAVRHTGTLIVVIYTKLGAGTGSAWDYADQIKTIMANKQVSRGLFTTESEIRRDGDEKDGYFGVICSTRYTSDEC